MRWLGPLALALIPGSLLGSLAIADQGSATTACGNLPFHFEPNLGQADPDVSFLARSSGATWFLGAGGAMLVGPAGARMRLVGSNPAPRVWGSDALPGRSHYFLGRDPAGWRTGIPHYARVRYEAVYPGIDLVFHASEEGELELDLLVAPGANPASIRLGFEGASRLRVDAAGGLVVATAEGELRLRRPQVYQQVGEERRLVRARYRLLGRGEVGLDLARHDRRRALVIDLVLGYSTYLGGSSYDEVSGLAVDAAGNSYLTGLTRSPNFPTQAALQPGPAGASEAFVAKIDPTRGRGDRCRPPASRVSSSAS